MNLVSRSLKYRAEAASDEAPAPGQAVARSADQIRPRAHVGDSGHRPRRAPHRRQRRWRAAARPRGIRRPPRAPRRTGTTSRGMSRREPRCSATQTILSGRGSESRRALHRCVARTAHAIAAMAGSTSVAGLRNSAGDPEVRAEAVPMPGTAPGSPPRRRVGCRGTARLLPMRPISTHMYETPATKKYERPWPRHAPRAAGAAGPAQTEEGHDRDRDRAEEQDGEGLDPARGVQLIDEARLRGH